MPILDIILNPQPTSDCKQWPVQWCCDWSDNPDVTPTVTGNALEAATDVLWAASGRQFGSCSLVLRPCKHECADAREHHYDRFFESDYGYPYPALIDGDWVNISCGQTSCVNGCSCTETSEVWLPATVASIDNITIDGTALSADAYRLDNGYIVVRQDGGEFPQCQDLSLPLGEVGTWSIAATYGKPVPMIGQMAVGELACELIKSCTDADDCVLPFTAVSVTRQGIQVDMADLITQIENGLLGLPKCDMFIKTYNPYNMKSGPTFISPDVKGYRYTR